MGIEVDGANQKLILDSDGDTYLEAATDDTVKVYVSGAEDLRIAANAINVLSGTTLTIDSGATITNSGTANGFSSADPSSADGDSLGTASAEWSDLYLADGGVIYFGNDQDVTLTHDPDDGLFLKSIATADNNPVLLTLQTGETDMAADDVIGKIAFQAPDEGTGTDAILVSAAIQAVAEGDHSSSSNATRLEFMTGSSEAATSQMAISSGGIVGIGAVPTPDLGVGLHIKTADSGASVHNDADELVIENSSTGGITILSGTSAEGRINFGDSGDNDIGRVNYSHASNYMTFYTNASETLRIDTNGKISTGAETASDCDAGGMTLDHNAADANILTFKNSDVAHPFTDHAEADTYAEYTKLGSTEGGMRVNYFSEATVGYAVASYAVNANTTHSTSGRATIEMDTWLDSGTDRTAPSADHNIFNVRAGGATKFMVEGNGMLHSDGGAQSAYDAYDDAQLIRAFDLSHGKGTINSKFDKFIGYNHEKLAELGIVGREDDGKPNHFINITLLQRLHNGAIWQQYEKHNQLLDAVYDLAKEAVGEDKANAILDKHEVKRLQ